MANEKCGGRRQGLPQRLVWIPTICVDGPGGNTLSSEIE